MAELPIKETMDTEQTLVETPPLTDWANEPKVVDLKNDLQEAMSHHETHVSKVGAWLDNMNATGSARIPKIIGRSSVVPKLIRKQAEWRYASLSEAFLSDENIFATDPVSWEDKDAAIQNGLVLNNQFNTQIDKVSFIDEYIRTAVDEGTVVVRTGWDFKEEEVTVPNMVVEEIVDEKLIDIISKTMETLMQDPDGSDAVPEDLMEIVNVSGEAGFPARLIQKGMKQEMKTLVNRPTVEVCEFSAVIIDPTCKGDISRAAFVIYKFETSLSDLRKEGKYSNLDQIQIETNAVQNEADYHSEDTGSFTFTDEPRKKFIAYEYWGFWDKDGNGETKPIVGTWVGNTLIRMEDSPFPDEGLPFILVQYLPKRKNVYGEPDGELLEDNQKIVGAVTRGMLDIMGRSAAGQTGVRKDALDVTNQRKFDQGKDYSFNPNVDAKSAFYHHVYPELPNSAQYMLNLQYMEAESMTGIKAFSQEGITGEGLGRSATAARSALDAASKRELGILRRLAKGITDIGRKIMAMNGEFLSDEEVIRVTNEEFITVKRDDLAGRVDIKLHISTAETDNAKAGELAFMLQTMGNSMPIEMSQLVLEDIALLRKMPELAKKIKEFKNEPSEMDVKMHQMEMDKLQAEIEEIKSKTVENYAEAKLDQAKAGAASADADKTNLDYVEQESGVTHARNLQQDGQQAEANLKRDIVKEVLKGGNEGS